MSQITLAVEELLHVCRLCDTTLQQFPGDAPVQTIIIPVYTLFVFVSSLCMCVCVCVCASFVYIRVLPALHVRFVFSHFL